MEPMSIREYDSTSPNELRQAKQAKQARFLEWCKKAGEDPEDEGAWDRFSEGDSFWEDADEDNLTGWEDNMNKD